MKLNPATVAGVDHLEDLVNAGLTRARGPGQITTAAWNAHEWAMRWADEETPG